MSPDVPTELCCPENSFVKKQANDVYEQVKKKKNICITFPVALLLSELPTS